jgi:hypothetical protein
MAMDVIHEKQQAHELIERLTADQLAAVVKLLQVMALDPVSRKLSLARMEDEEIGEEEERAVVEAREWLKHNQPIPHEEVLAQFGLTVDDFRTMGETPLPPSSSNNG